MKPIYIHYNRDNYQAPDGQSDRWNNYVAVEEEKLFLACCESWRRNGWEPRRLSTKGWQVWHPNSEVIKSSPYPIEYWQIWWKLAHHTPCWVCSMDVFNFGFSPTQARFIEPRESDPPGLTLSRNSFSAAVLFLTDKLRESIIQTVLNFDKDPRPLSCTIVSDESIFREYGPNYNVFSKLPYCALSCDSDVDNFPLVHFSKSATRMQGETATL